MTIGVPGLDRPGVPLLAEHLLAPPAPRLVAQPLHRVLPPALDPPTPRHRTDVAAPVVFRIPDEAQHRSRRLPRQVAALVYLPHGDEPTDRPRHPDAILGR